MFFPFHCLFAHISLRIPWEDAEQKALVAKGFIPVAFLRCPQSDEKIRSLLNPHTQVQ